jgi:hypothetical protein
VYAQWPWAFGMGGFYSGFKRTFANVRAATRIRIPASSPPLQFSVSKIPPLAPLSHWLTLSPRCKYAEGDIANESGKEIKGIENGREGKEIKKKRKEIWKMKSRTRRKG